MHYIPYDYDERTAEVLAARARLARQRRQYDALHSEPRDPERRDFFRDEDEDEDD